MSWAEVKKINDNIAEPLDELIKRIAARRSKTIYQSITAARATITTNQVAADVQGAGIFRRIYVTGGVRAHDTTTYPNFYVHPGVLNIDGIQRFAWNGSQASTLNTGAYINYQGAVTPWVGSGNQNVAGSPFYQNANAFGSWPLIFKVDLDWRFNEGFRINLSALSAPAMNGNGVTTIHLLYDLEDEA